MNANDNVGVYSWDCLYAQAAVNNRGLECHCGIDKGALTFHATTSVWIRLVMKRASLWPGSKKTNESGFSSVNECHFLVGVLMSAGSWCAIKSSLSCRVDTCRAFQTLEVCEGADAPLGLLTHFIYKAPICRDACCFVAGTPDVAAAHGSSARLLHDVICCGDE